MSFLLRIPIRFYRMILSPLLHALTGCTGSGCRFHPSCSAYALESLQIHGASRGVLLALRRILKFHPWHEGGFDPVPNSTSPAFSPQP